jgi:hypothetical protein
MPVMLAAVGAKPLRSVMKRDMELARTIMLRLEAVPENSHLSNRPEDLRLLERSAAEIAYHLKLLVDAGFVDGEPYLSGSFGIKTITWRGHEFLDDTRDPTIWDKAKGRAAGAAHVGIGLLWEIAKAEIKAKLGLP